jgi:hypothetical protein
MPKAGPHSLLNHTRGKISQFVCRSFRGRTIIQRAPVFTQPWSDAQKQTRATFSGGSAYARRVAADPLLRDRYKACAHRHRLTYRHMAIRDYFNPPEVTGLVVANYTPASGGHLIAGAADDFEVARVTFTFYAADGTLLHESAAAPVNGDWHLTVPPPPPGAPLAARVTITAYDHPANSDTKSFALLNG